VRAKRGQFGRKLSGAFGLAALAAGEQQVANAMLGHQVPAD